MRLQVLLARCGLGSRRACEDLIRQGRVSVDGKPVTELGARVNPGEQTIEFDTEPIRPERTVCYMVNKPKGVLCTNRDPAGRMRVIDLFPPEAGRVFPIGRLDENSVGLLLVTNDGELSHKLAHPRFRVPKIYQVQVKGVPSGETLKKARTGVYFSDGLFRVDRVKKLRSKGKSATLEVTLEEGRNREIRRLFAKLGHKVMQLERVQFGPLELRNVAPGRYRALTKKEMKLLTEFVEAGPERRQAERPKRSGRKKAARQRRQADTPKTVEVSPLPNRGGLDITGRRRHGVQSDDADSERDESSSKPHPAIVKSNSGKKRRR